VRERREVGLPERAEQRDAGEGIVAVERICEALHGLDARGRSSGGEQVHDHQQRSPHGLFRDRGALAGHAVPDHQMLEALPGQWIDRSVLAGAGPHRHAVDRPARSQRAIHRLACGRQPLADAVGEHDACPPPGDGDDVRLGEIESGDQHAHARESTRAARACLRLLRSVTVVGAIRSLPASRRS
jgi:hypothetical protein